MTEKWNGLIMFLGSENLEETDKFYASILGLSLFKDQGACRIYSVPGGGRLGFCTHLSVTQGERSPIITLLADDVDGVYARLYESGHIPHHPPKTNPRFNIYHFFVTDPNGYWVEVQQFLD